MEQPRVLRYKEKPPRSEWEAVHQCIRRYMTKRPKVFMFRLLLLAAAGAIFEGLYLRFGPPSMYADAEVPEGERAVWCAHNDTQLGKVAVTLHRAQVSKVDLVAPPS